MPKKLDAAVSNRVAQNLRKFGYTHLTNEEVQIVCDKLLNGEDAKDLGIIAMFSKTMLEEGGYLYD